VFAAETLGFTRDPFDAFIVATTQTLGLPLVTRDAAIRGSGTVTIVW
jgi:PIN domain nuclease of toxin-antitoxin system